MPDRIRTSELLGLIELSVPRSSIHKTESSILVVYRSIVAIERRGDGWVAVACEPAPSAVIGRTLEQLVQAHTSTTYTFRDVDQALALCERLWPLNDATADEMYAEVMAKIPDEEEAQHLAQLLERVRITIAKEGSDG